MDNAGSLVIETSATRFHAMFEHAAIGMACLDLRGPRFLDVNAALCAMLGRSPNELRAMKWTGIAHPDDIDLEEFARLGTGEIEKLVIDRRMVHRDGHLLHARLHVSVVRDAQDAPDFAVAVIEDITERWRKRIALAEAESRHAFLLALTDRLSAAPDAAAMMAVAAEMLGHHLGVARAGYAEFDDQAETITIDRCWTDGQVSDMAGTWRAEDFGTGLLASAQSGAAIVVADIAQDRRTNQPTFLAAYHGIQVAAMINAPLIRAGRLVALMFVHHATPRAWTEAEVMLVAAVAERVRGAVKQARAEAAFAENEAHTRAIMDSMPQMVWSTRPDGYHDFYNRRWYEFTGMAEGSTEGDSWNVIIHPDDEARAWARWSHSLATGENYEIEYRLRHHSGLYRWTLGRAVPVRDRAGRITRWMGTCTELQEIIEFRDSLAISRTELERRVAERTAELRRANQRLTEEMREREVVQAALNQSQKLEALGQLTSGVAHDFNNVIAAIAGGFAVIERRTQDPRLLDVARLGARAAWRGAALVRQLLAFARQQKLEPERVELAALLTESTELLRSSLNPGVTLTVACAPDLGPVLVDPSQLEAALINLAVNARDAMEGGGTLTVSARPCPADTPGRPPQLGRRDAAVIDVTDTGTGMSPELLLRVMEPFFTTKAPGRGTGLGLAMVHGFVSQSAGAMHIASQPGQGTTISLFLPCAEAKDSPRATPVETGADTAAIPAHRASILLVDDDEAVRGVVAEILRDLGFLVIEAANSTAALSAIRDEAAIDLVLTDVVMPDVSGPALAALLRHERQDVPILFMTGHAERYRLDNEAVIEKPFLPDALVARIHDILASQQTAERIPGE